MSAFGKEVSFSLSFVQARGSCRECTDFLGRFQMELVCLDVARKLHWGWRRGLSFPLITTPRSHLSQLSSLLQLLPLAPDHPLIHFFQIKTLNELHNPSEHELQLCDRLLGHDFFPNSLWIMSLRACVLYHLHGMSILLSFSFHT